jgi:hypothetical protein
MWRPAGQWHQRALSSIIPNFQEEFMRRVFSFPFVLVLLALLATISPKSFAQIGISVSFGPPALPVYVQPPCPEPGYMWTPGYWAWDADYGDYYWVPGTWVMAPEAGYLWTPPWWGWENGAYLFHEGYWGPHIGFYGGINYGFGYPGEGFYGGRWDHDHFFYNRSVTNINITNIHNVYNETVINRTVNRVSYNGGPGGINAHPLHQDEVAAGERHIGPVQTQAEHLQTARFDPELRAGQNHGRPPVAATQRPTQYRGSGVVAARASGGSYQPRPNSFNAPRSSGSAASGGRPFTHPNDLPQFNRVNPPNGGNSASNQRFQQQQDQLFARQQQERQQLQQRQEQEHQQFQQRGGNNQPRMQQMEQQHQMQTQRLQQRQFNEVQQFRQRQGPGKR